LGEAPGSARRPHDGTRVQRAWSHSPQNGLLRSIGARGGAIGCFIARQPPWDSASTFSDTLRCSGVIGGCPAAVLSRIVRHSENASERSSGYRSREVLVLYRKRSGEDISWNARHQSAGAFSIQRLEGSRCGTFELCIFEFRRMSRKLAVEKMQRPWDSPLALGRWISRESQPHARPRSHTYGDSSGRRAVARMRKIESWLIGDKRWGPPSKLQGAEPLDESHRAAALGTCPERPWCARAFFRRLSFEKPA